MPTKPKKLTLDEIRKIDKKEYGAVEKIKIGDYVVSIQKKLRPTEISKLIEEAMLILGEIVEKELDVRSTMTPLLSTLVIKHFTDVSGIPDDLAGLIEATNYLVDNDFLTPIIAHFDPDELTKMNQHLAKVINGIDGVNTSVELAKAGEKAEKLDAQK